MYIIYMFSKSKKIQRQRSKRRTDKSKRSKKTKRNTKTKTKREKKEKGGYGSYTNEITVLENNSINTPNISDHKEKINIYNQYLHLYLNELDKPENKDNTELQNIKTNEIVSYFKNKEFSEECKSIENKMTLTTYTIINKFINIDDTETLSEDNKKSINDSLSKFIGNKLVNYSNLCKR
jgi:hypothetical protein